MKLCTFELKTQLGKHPLLGAFINEGIVDLNSACAWHLHQKACRVQFATGQPCMSDYKSDSTQRTSDYKSDSTYNLKLS